MKLIKCIWAMRAILYTPFFKKIEFPTYIGKPVYLCNAKNITLGKKCRIYPGWRAEIVDDKSFLSIGKNVSIGQNFHVVSYLDDLQIGDNVTISGNVLITNCDHSYEKNNCSILENDLLPKKTIIGDNVFIGYGAVIQAGTILGEGCIVGANAVVRGNYPAKSIIVGVPGKIIKCREEKDETI